MTKLFRKISISVIATAAFWLLPLGADALTISPPLIDHQLNPGDTVLETIKIYNEDSQAITVYPLLRNFTAGDDENGEPQFMPPEVDDHGTGLAEWVIMDNKTMTIGPKERTNLSLALNVPNDAQPGGHYGAVILSIEPPSDKPGVGVAQQLGALMMLRVSGEVKEVASIAEFGFVKPKIWYNYLPVDFFLRFENSGNTHLRPAGNLFITNMWGKQVASINANEDFRSVLPRSIRKYTFGWEKTSVNDEYSELEKEWKNFGFGKYKAVLVIYYGNDNKMVVAEREFTVWPWRLMLIFGAGLLVLVGLIIILFKIYRKNLIAKLEKAMAKRKGLKTDRQLRDEMEAELRKKLEKEMRTKIEQETMIKKDDHENDKPKTELPDELKED